VLADALGLSPSERAELAAAARRVAPSRGSVGRSTLPLPPTPLVGRERELADALAAVRDRGARLLTLVGPGGSGKTRLVLALAEELTGEHRPVVFVDLAPVADPDLVASAIQEALRVNDVPGRSTEQRLVEHLAGRRALLVLDNLEHLLPTAPLVATLLARCPELRLLVTSRVPLRVQGEQVGPCRRCRCRSRARRQGALRWPADPPWPCSSSGRRPRPSGPGVEEAVCPSRRPSAAPGRR
jgi:hypothetical protein